MSVKRYWPGKAPEWANEAEEDDQDLTNKEKVFQDESELDRKDDPRLRRLALSRVGNKEEIRADHKRIRQAEENERQERMDLEDDDEGALEERRRRTREEVLAREPEEMMEVEEEDETDSEEELMGNVMVKTVFVAKSERDTIAERERLEAEELAREEMMKRRREEQKVETKQIVVVEIRKDEEIQKNLEAEANIGDVDTDDELNEAEEYEAWKVREIARIKRAMIKDKEEIGKVRNMTEEEIGKNPKALPQPKRKRRFMQKYFHKGAFFQSDADDLAATASPNGIYTRDFSAPTGEDKLDKTVLPKVMQVKHFGRSGRTKWTHLVNEDTTDWNNLWTYNDPLRAKYNAKMAGMNVPIEKPKGSKKLKDWDSRALGVQLKVQIFNTILQTSIC